MPAIDWIGGGRGVVDATQGTRCRNRSTGARSRPPRARLTNIKPAERARRRAGVQDATPDQRLFGLDGEEGQARQRQAQQQLARGQRLGLEDRVAATARRSSPAAARTSAPPRRASGRFDNRPCVNSDSRSERIASTCAICDSVSTVKTMRLPVRGAAVQRPGLRRPAYTPPISSPTQTMCCHSPCAKMLSLRRPRRALHDAALGRLGGQRQAGQAVGDQVDPQDVDRQQRDRQAEEAARGTMVQISPELPVIA